jgi:prepilin-type N-terminal cleavage/methylation domain-containing protein
MQRIRSQKQGHQRGFTVLEVMIATLIFLVASTGILGMITVAAVRNAGHGAQGTRTTEYASSKMEQLMALQFTSLGPSTMTPSTSYPSPFPATTAGNCADPNYCDYIVQGTNSDTVSTSPTGAGYMRQWQISLDPTGNVKTVTVIATSLQVIGTIAPSTTLISQRTNY